MQRLLPFTAAALALAVGGCVSAPGELTPQRNTSVYSLHQPVVERTDFVFDVATSGDRVPPAELDRLDAWFSSIGLRYGDRVTVDAGQGYVGARAHEDVARVAGRYGILLSDGAPITHGPVPPGALRVIASRSTASVPGCPTWSDTGIALSTTTSSNYGCALNSNLAAMVADPNDLVLGEEGSVSGSAGTASRAIRVYRQRQPTGQQGLPATSTTGNRQ